VQVEREVAILVLQKLAFVVMFGLILGVAAGGPARAQADKPGLSGGSVIGATPGISTDVVSPTVRFGSSQIPQRHMDSNGRPCIYVLGEAKPQVINPTLYDQVLIIHNSCSVPVKLRACYFGTEKCNDFTAAAYANRREIFGIAPNGKDFRFEFREYFN
jgi:hypothetical protein